MTRQQTMFGSVCISAIALFQASSVTAFAPTTSFTQQRSPQQMTPPSAASSTHLNAKPKRLEDNVDGPLYVNDKCINCAACSHFAPTVFSRSPKDNAHVVHHQPSSELEIEQARASLSACPVAAIRVETNADRSHRGLPEQSEEEKELTPKLAINPKFNGLEHPFPRPVAPDAASDVHFIGHHNDASFGATPYVFGISSQTADREKDWIMVDTPRYSKSAIATVEKVTGSVGPKYLFLTHVDDTADHQKWKDHYPDLKRIFHAGDLGRHNWIGDKRLEDVEILLPATDVPAHEATNMPTFRLDGTPIPPTASIAEEEAVILHTPGHSPGSITLWKRPTETSEGVIFSGDTYAFSTRGGGRMSAFPRYGNNLRTQGETIGKLVAMNDDNKAWSVVAPGHGHKRDYTTMPAGSMQSDYDDALEELKAYYRYD